MTFQNIFTITKKELRGYFDNPTAYIVLVVFLVLWEFLFFRSALLVGEASLHILFAFLPWLALILVPAITMGSISKEKDEGTLELLLTHPLTEKELILGKFFAGVCFLLIALLFVLPVGLSFGKFGNLDWGVVAGQLLASVFFGSALIALGLWISALLKNQISSLLITAAAGFILMLVGTEFTTAPLPLFLVPFLEQLSLLTHFQSMARGVIDLRDLWYFITLILIFTTLAHLQLRKQKFGGRRLLYRAQQIGVLALIGIAIVSNTLGARIPGRIDLTQGRLYSLTAATREALGTLEKEVGITLFASKELPSPLQPVLREVKDTLRDYKTWGKGKVKIFVKNPIGKPETIQEAAKLGVGEVQFNVVGNEEFQLKKGYLGLAVNAGEQHESIPFMQDTNDLEYQLTSFIKKLTTDEKKKIVFLTGHGEKSISYDYRSFASELKKQFLVEEFSFSEESSSFPGDVAALVVAGPSEEIDKSSRDAIRAYLAQGGSALFLIDAFKVNPQGLQVTLNQESFANFIEELGVKVEKEMVYDLRSNETVRFGGGFITYLLPYPFWPRVVAADKASPLTAKIHDIVLPWASPLKIDESRVTASGPEITRLFTTTKTGGTQTTSTLSIAPDASPPQINLGERLVAATINIAPQSTAAEQAPQNGRAVIVGDSDFLTDQFAQNLPNNIGFGLEALSWLTQEESLAGIQLKQSANRQLRFEDNTQPMLVKYGNMAFAALLPLLIGTFRIMRRKNLRNSSYSSRS